MQSLNEYCFGGEDGRTVKKSNLLVSLFDFAGICAIIALEVGTMLGIITIGVVLTFVSAPILFWLK